MDSDSASSPCYSSVDGELFDFLNSVELIDDHENDNENIDDIDDGMEVILSSWNNGSSVDDERDWGSSMPKELLTKIVEHVQHFEDFETMSQVCSSWRSAACDAIFGRERLNNNQTHTLPWLLLPKNGADNYHSTCRLYSLSKREVRCVNLPAHKNDTYRFLSSHGWLLLVLDGQSGENVCLFNPYSAYTIIPPPVNLSCPNCQGIPFFDSKFVLSANPSSTRDFIIFLALEQPLYINLLPAMLVYWRSNYDRWIQIAEPPIPLGLALEPPQLTRFLDSMCRDITFYQGEFYGINFHGHVVKFQTLQDKPHYEFITILETGYGELGNRQFEPDEKCFYYLVESRDKLLVIAQEAWVELDNLNSYYVRRTRSFEVFELNVNNGTLNPVPSLGKRSIFIGSNSSFSVEVSHDNDHGFKPNCIYNTDDRVTWAWTACGYGQKDACVYNLSNGMIDKFYHGPSLQPGRLTSFTWVESPHPSDKLEPT